MKRLRYIPLSTWTSFVWIHAVCNTIASIIAINRLISHQKKHENLWYWTLFIGAIPSLTLRYYTGSINWTHLASIINILCVSLHTMFQLGQLSVLGIDIWLIMSLLVGGSGGLVRHTIIDQYVSWERVSLVLSIVAGPFVAYRLATEEKNAKAVKHLFRQQ